MLPARGPRLRVFVFPERALRHIGGTAIGATSIRPRRAAMASFSSVEGAVRQKSVLAIFPPECASEAGLRRADDLSYVPTFPDTNALRPAGVRHPEATLGVECNPIWGSRNSRLDRHTTVRPDGCHDSVEEV